MHVPCVTWLAPWLLWTRRADDGDMVARRSVRRGCLGCDWRWTGHCTRCRGVLIALIAVGTVGLLCGAVGVAAIIDGQPYGIYYPLLVVGFGLYWLAIPLIAAIDMAYRAVLANRPGGVNLLHPMWWSSAVIREDWRPQGRYGRWVNPLNAVHALVGSVILIWGVWRFLVGAGFEEGFPGVFVGGGFLLSAGELWLIKALTLWWSSRTNEQQRLAAEELRRS